MVLVCVLMASGGDREGWGLEKKAGSPITAPPSEPTKNTSMGKPGTEKGGNEGDTCVQVLTMHDNVLLVLKAIFADGGPTPPEFIANTCEMYTYTCK